MRPRRRPSHAPMRTALALALVLAPGLALAQPARRCTPEETRTVSTLGRAAYEARDAGNHARAAEIARAALAVCPSAALHYFAAYEEFAAGELPAAREHVDACVREVGFDATRRDLAVECRVLSERLATEERAQHGALAPEPELHPVTPPSPPAVTSNTPPSSPPPRMPPPRRAPHPSQGPGAGPWVLVGVGAGALVAFGAFAALRASSLSGCLIEGERAVCDTPQDAARAGDAGTWATAGNVALGVGLAAVAGGLAWWTLGTLTRGREAHVTLAVGPSSIGVVGRW